MNRLLWVAALSFVLACSGGDTGGAGGGSGGSGTGGGGKAGGSGTGGGTGGGTATGGGTGGGTATGGGTGTGGGTSGTKSGAVVLTQICTDVAGTLYCSGSAAAGFTTVTTSGGASGCTTSTLGGCKVVECVPTDGGATATSVDNSAGTVTITGTLDGGLTLVPSDAGTYAAVNRNDQLWNGGENLTIAAAGGIVPMFSGKTVKAPSDLIVMMPGCQLGDCGTMSKSTAFPLSFAAVSGDRVLALVTSTKGETVTSITCTPTSSPATIPIAALARLGTNDAGFVNTFTLAPSNETTFTSGAYSITATATGTPMSGFVTVTP